MSEVEEKKGYCTLCRSRCGTLNTVQGTHLIKVRPDNSHPTGTAMCMKGKAAPELVHSPDRILYPMRRTTPKGSSDPGWERITWDAALGEIAAKLHQFKQESGAESVVFGVTTPSGTPISDSIDWIERFIWSFGSPNICYATEICNWHKDVAHEFTFGCGIPTADYQHSDVILLWGTNPTSTWLAQADAIARGRRNGAKLIVVDPRPTALAREADVWLNVRPGTDAALAMGIARQVIHSQTTDTGFVRRWTNGPLLVRMDTGHFLRERDLDPAAAENRYMVWSSTQGHAICIDAHLSDEPLDHALDGTFTVLEHDAESGTENTHAAASVDHLSGLAPSSPDGVGFRPRRVTCRPAYGLFKEAVEAWTPEKVAAITGVSADALMHAAALLIPGSRIAYHAWSGVGQHTNATQTERAIATLYALTGAFDTRGSNREFVKQPANVISDFALLDEVQRKKALGLDERPLGPPAHGWVTARDVYRAITEAKPYKVRALFAFGTNLLVSQANHDDADAALRALEFHVHCDLFDTPSSRYADIFLPINTPWEREGLRLGFEINETAVELVQLRQKMVPARGESRADYDIVLDLAVRLGMGDAFFDGDIEAGWNHVLAPLQLDVTTLRQHPEGLYHRLVQQERRYASRTNEGVRGFKTETGRVELYSEKLLRHGYPPVPRYVPPDGYPAAQSRAPRRFPYVLTSMKNGYYCHSQHRGLASLRRRAPYPVAEISPALAREKTLIEDDWLQLRTANGTARFRARIVPGMAHDVIAAEYGWWQGCADVGMDALPTHGKLNSNFGRLASSERLDPISGSTALRSIPCDVSLDPSVDPARRAWQGYRDFIVRDIEEEAKGVRVVTFNAADGGMLPDYLPGQHVTLHLPSLGASGITRAYSLIGRGTQAQRRHYAVAIRHQIRVTAEGETAEGTMSSHVHRDLKIGDTVQLRPPGGTFVLPLGTRLPVVMFAGGIGITPFLSYLESLVSDAHSDKEAVALDGTSPNDVDVGVDADVDADAANAASNSASNPASIRQPEMWLYYANLDRPSHAFRERLKTLKAALPSLHLIDCYRSPASQEEQEDQIWDQRDGVEQDVPLRGYLTADVVSDDLIERRARFYFCGPDRMMDQLTAGLVSRGVPAFDIFKEAFRSPSMPVMDASQTYPVEFTRSKQTVQWTPANGSLLSFAESLGIAIPSGCRVGQCESCAVRVVSGNVAHLSGSGPDEADLCFACQAVPSSAIALDA